MQKRIVVTVLLISCLCLPLSASWGDAVNDAIDRGRVDLDKGQPLKAIDQFSYAIRLHPQDAHPYAWRGLARMLASARPAMRKKANEDFARAAALAPGDGFVYALRARGWAALHDDHLAEDDFARAITVEPARVDTWLARATFFNDTLEQYGKAVSDFTHALTLRPDDPLIYNDRAHALANLQRFDEAMADYAKAMQLAPDLALSWCNRGRTRYEMQDYDRAIDDEEHALRMNPAYDRAMYWRGRALLGNGQLAAAVAQLTAYVHARPDEADGYLARADAYDAIGRRDLGTEDRYQAAVLRARQTHTPPPPPVVPTSSNPQAAPSGKPAVPAREVHW